MSYWIPFRKKQENSQKPMMLGLETALRLQDMANDLCSERKHVPPQPSIGFFCGLTENDTGKELVPFFPGTIHPVKNQDPPMILTEKVCTDNNLCIIVSLPRPAAKPEYLIFPTPQYIFELCEITEAPLCISVGASFRNLVGQYQLVKANG